MIPFNLKRLPDTMKQEAPTLTKEQIRFLKRKESARDFLFPLGKGTHQFGFSKGSFSLIDVIDELVSEFPNGSMALSTWTAARSDLARLKSLIEGKAVANFRLLIDSTFSTRQPALLAAIREHYGPEAVRITKNHAKFVLYKTDQLKIVIRTSMNLNFNPRFEDIDVSESPPLFDFLDDLLNQFFNQFPGHGQINLPALQVANQFKQFKQSNNQ